MAPPPSSSPATSATPTPPRVAPPPVRATPSLAGPPSVEGRAALAALAFSPAASVGATDAAEAEGGGRFTAGAFASAEGELGPCFSGCRKSARPLLRSAAAFSSCFRRVASCAAALCAAGVALSSLCCASSPATADAAAPAVTVPPARRATPAVTAPAAEAPAATGGGGSSHANAHRPPSPPWFRPRTHSRLRRHGPSWAAIEVEAPRPLTLAAAPSPSPQPPTAAAPAALRAAATLPLLPTPRAVALRAAAAAAAASLHAAAATAGSGRSEHLPPLPWWWSPRVHWGCLSHCDGRLTPRAVALDAALAAASVARRSVRLCSFVDGAAAPPDTLRPGGSARCGARRSPDGAPLLWPLPPPLPLPLPLPPPLPLPLPLPSGNAGPLWKQSRRRSCAARAAPSPPSSSPAATARPPSGFAWWSQMASTSTNLAFLTSAELIPEISTWQSTSSACTSASARTWTHMVAGWRHLVTGGMVTSGMVTGGVHVWLQG